MKKITFALAALLAANASFARDEVHMVPLADAVQMGIEQGKLDGLVTFHLSGAKTPPVQSMMGEGVSNRKTNSVGKDTVTACKWAALSALMAFEASAKQRGANAVVDMHSYYKKQVLKDPVNFECHDGALMTGVTLKGTYAKVAR